VDHQDSGRTNFIDKVDKQAVNGHIPDDAWGTFENFVKALKKSFEDPNRGKTAYNQLEKFTYTPGRRADEFFQEFETLAGRAGYMTPEPNDVYLIDLVERKVPAPLIRKVYQDEVPTVYADYKDKIIRFDNLERRLNVIAPAQQKQGTFPFFYPPTNHYAIIPSKTGATRYESQSPQRKATLEAATVDE